MNTQCGIAQKPAKGATRGWQSNATLVFNYEKDDNSVPTFACAYTLGRYSLLVLLRMEGNQDAKFRLRVPLRVACMGRPRPLRAAEAGDLHASMYFEEMDAMPPTYTAQ